jgi:hypothetical protein
MKTLHPYLTLILAALVASGCGDDDGSNNNNNTHSHVCAPACTGDDVCQHGGICAPRCEIAVNRTVCETYDPDGEVLFCHPDDGLCEPAGVACTASDIGDCAVGNVCQIFVNGGTCASPCASVGGTPFCEKLDPLFLCHASQQGGTCAPACDGAGGTLDCADLPGPESTCDATSGECLPVME